jgi:purine catabolism regulator
MLPGLRAAFEQRGAPALIGVSDQDLLGLVARPAGDGDPRDWIAEAMRHVLREHGVDPAAVVLVMGESADSWEALGLQLSRARRRARAVVALPPRGWFDARSSDVLDLLNEIDDTDAMARFVDEQLEPFLDESGSRNAAMLETLRVLIEHGGRKASAARALHLDRGSLYPRLQRIEELLGVDLADPRTLLSLHLALEAREVLRRRSTP